MHQERNPSLQPAVASSNRGPLTVTVDDDGEDRVERGGGGLVSGMVAALEQADDAVWVCAAMSDRERALARRAGDGPLSAVGIDTGSLDVRMLPIDANTFRQAYTGSRTRRSGTSTICCSTAPTAPPSTPPGDGSGTATAATTRRFADALATRRAGAGGDGAGLPPVPRAGHGPRTRPRHPHQPLHPHAVGPGRTRSGCSPTPSPRELLHGVLGADLLGFHTRRWADAFLDCVADTLVDGRSGATIDGGS